MAKPENAAEPAPKTVDERLDEIEARVRWLESKFRREPQPAADCAA